MNPFVNLSRLAALSVISGSLFVAAPVLADDTADFQVTAEVTASCSIEATPLVFGAYDPAVANLTAPLNGTSTVSVLCTNGFGTFITLDEGANGIGVDADSPERQMADGAALLGYGLFTEGGFGDVWGGTAATGFAHTGTGVLQVHTIHGQIPGAQNVVEGSYSDTVTATVLF